MSNINQQQFDDLLEEILADTPAGPLLSIPGIFEVLAEHFNNDVIKRFEEQEEEAFEAWEGRLWANHDGKFAANY